MVFGFCVEIGGYLKKLVSLVFMKSFLAKSWLANKVVSQKQKPKTILKTTNNQHLNLKNTSLPKGVKYV